MQDSCPNAVTVTDSPEVPSEAELRVHDDMRRGAERLKQEIG